MGLDPSISAFAAASGATDLTALNNLAKYLRSQSLISSARCFPFKSAQNAGSGSTVYGWGDLTANNCTLVNSPTWGAVGVTFNGSTQYGTIGDVLDMALGDLSVFGKFKYNATGTTQSILSKKLGAVVNLDDGYMVYTENNNTLRANLSSGSVRRTAINSEVLADETEYTYAITWDRDDSLILDILDAGTNTATISAESGDDISNSVALEIGRNNNNGAPSLYFAGGIASVLFIAAPLTTTQREAITDLVNAL